jgi:RNA-directed DNA polymerase
MIEIITKLTSRNQLMNMANKSGQQISETSIGDESLTKHLMEKICERANLNRAYKRVKANKGTAGIDGMTVNELSSWIAKHKDSLIESLLTGTYQPQSVLGIEIPKPGKNKGIRLLGIPTVVDRLVQQAILQVLEPILDPTFSDSSYGYRPGRSAHQALKKAQEYVREGNKIVVDIDIDNFFNRINHDILMKIIRRFLEAGMMKQGVCVERREGVPQGGPLSPFMSNILLDELDKELEHRGHKFCRFADDVNIYVKSLRAGKRVLESVQQFLERRLKLKINETKSGHASVDECQFLGYRLLCEGKLGIAKHSIERVKNKVRALTQRNRGVSFETVISELNEKLRGWINYFRLTECFSELERLDAWIRRKLRCYRLKQRKRSWSIAKFLIKLGAPAKKAWLVANSSKGWWRLSMTPPVHQSMNNVWFKEQGLISLTKQRALLNV